ncbi:MAG: hypothetical protein ABS46_00295 [Cytophagaceae bacterium SCN 52-12]|nr:MAG: hypothetical protein ABS46_00295 [Cytophagaceae bacterium SCN 52-12]
MKSFVKTLSLVFLFCSSLLLQSSFTEVPDQKASFKMPYRQAGLSQQQAAAHLLNRLAFGSLPGQVEEVVKTGLEKWVVQQLEGSLPDDSLNRLLSRYEFLQLSNAQIAQKYTTAGEVVSKAVKEGLINKDSIQNFGPQERKTFVDVYIKAHNLRLTQELYRQLIEQKILRAACSNNQLTEVLTDFWFNHFNVSIAKTSCAEFIPGYERDVIRPRVTGKFGDLLLATAKSPAMLYYLDNVRSSGSGLNENYAREVMELHTLGVDGGYSQEDVTQAARVLTGWTVYPVSQMSDNDSIEKANEARLVKGGSVRDGDFLFAANRHDKGEKTVLGVKFNNEGYQEGVRLLEMLARHPSAAAFISRKLAVRFVSDDPPQSLVEKMARTFKKTDGDIRQVLITMVSSREFWDTAAVRQKIKSPFELAISAVRGLGADFEDPYPLYAWINRMGQKVYYYPAPTGFPDKAQSWINTGALLNRMNFGLALASQRVKGTKFNLLELNHYHEPESPAAALTAYGRILLPGRDLDETVKRLSPILNDPDLNGKIEAAVKKKAAAKPDTALVSDEMSASAGKQEKGEKKEQTPASRAAENRAALVQVVGMLVGSPEFQRR